MASSTLAALSAASALDGSELFYTVQGGADKKATGTQIQTFALAPLVVESANLVAQRNSTTAQNFRIYNTYTSSTNGEYLDILWTSNTLQMWSTKGSAGGTVRSMKIGITEDYASGALLYLEGGSTGEVRISAGGLPNICCGALDSVAGWNIGSSAQGYHLVPGTDNAIDVGKTTARVRAVLTGICSLIDGITAPSTVAGQAQIYVDTSDGDLKIKFGDGTVKTIVVDT